MRIVRQSAFVASPWKNGGGITHEALRVPAEGPTFRWRVSVAQIDVSGPFSDFTGYERKMVLLRGAGVRLSPRGGDPLLLRAPGDLAEFDGGVAMDCELLDGSCTDLNLMVSRSIPGVQAWVRTLTSDPAPTGSAAAATTLVLPIRGALAVIDGDDEPIALNPWDLAILTHGDRVALRPAANDPAPLVFFATLDDNSW